MQFMRNCLHTLAISCSAKIKMFKQTICTISSLHIRKLFWNYFPENPKKNHLKSWNIYVVSEGMRNVFLLQEIVNLDE